MRRGSPARLVGHSGAPPVEFLPWLCYSFHKGTPREHSPAVHLGVVADFSGAKYPQYVFTLRFLGGMRGSCIGQAVYELERRMTELATTPEALALHKRFCDDVMSMPGGEKIKICQQCGTCTGSCPTSYLMDWGPREIIAAFRAYDLCSGCATHTLPGDMPLEVTVKSEATCAVITSVTRSR